MKNQDNSKCSTIKYQFTLFEQLSTELFYDIFEYFWTEEIFHSFSNLNHRIKSIIELYYVHRINFQSIRKSTFHLICQSILPERVSSLVLSDQNDTCGQSKFFLLHFQIEQFTNLRSIKLIKLEHESLCRLLPNLFKLKQLQSLSLNNSTRIQMHINSEDKKVPRMLDWSPLHQLCNQVFPQLTNLSTIYTTNLTTVHFPNLLHLDLCTIDREVYIRKIFQHAPRLKSLTIDLIYFREFTMNQPCYSLKQLNVTST
ncbi:unnamed protein product, partial [Adineta ricciae]